MTETIGLTGVNPKIRCNGDGKWFEFEFQGHDGKLYCFRAAHEFAPAFITLLISAADMLAQRRGADKGPQPGDYYKGNGRNVEKVHVAATDDWKGMLLSLYLAPNVSQGFILPRELALGLAHDIQETEKAAILNQDNPLAAPLAKPTTKATRQKKSTKRNKGTSKKQVH